MASLALVLNGPIVSRRSIADRFLTLALSLALLSVMLAIPAMTGCNSATALTEVEKFELVILNVLNLACVINSGLPICGTMTQTIGNDYALLIKLWGDYNAAVKAGTSTVAIWNALNAAFATFENDSALIFAAASGLNAPELMAIVAAAQVLLAAIETLFPAAPDGAAAARPAKFAAHAAGRSHYDRAWFQSWATDYNAKIEMAQKMYPKAKLAKVHLKYA